MLEHIDIPKQDLYDGDESGLYDRTFALPVDNISFSITDLDGNDFCRLQTQVGDAAFERVITDAGIQRYKDTYKGAYGLSLEFLVRGGYLFVFAIGELSPGRGQLTLQGAWRIA